jgi:hypothetical protein
MQLSPIRNSPTTLRSDIRGAVLRGAPDPGNFPGAALSFTSCYVYSPRAAGLLGDASRQLCARIKRSDPVWLPHYAGCVHRESLRDSQLAALFTGAVLVPVPGSAITREVPWPALQLTVALRGVGLADRVWLGLGRRIAVRKSATAPSAERPSVREHYESLAVLPVRDAVSRILLVDDVVTKGRTLLAAAARLEIELPQADIRAFALIRTQGFVNRMTRVFEPCHEFIRWSGGDARREP